MNYSGSWKISRETFQPLAAPTNVYGAGPVTRPTKGDLMDFADRATSRGVRLITPRTIQRNNHEQYS